MMPVDRITIERALHVGAAMHAICAAWTRAALESRNHIRGAWPALGRGLDVMTERQRAVRSFDSVAAMAAGEASSQLMVVWVTAPQSDVHRGTVRAWLPDLATALDTLAHYSAPELAAVLKRGNRRAG